MSQGESILESDLPYDSSTPGYLGLGQSAYSWITGKGGANGDWDLYSVYLVAGTNYDFFCAGTGLNGVSGAKDMYLELYNNTGFFMRGYSPSADGSVKANFTAQTSGFYYIAASGDQESDVGGYRIAVSASGSAVDDHGAEFWNAKTISSGRHHGNLERANDIDSFLLNMVAGKRYFYTIESDVSDLVNIIDNKDHERLYADTVDNSNFVELNSDISQQLKISFSSDTFVRTGAYSFNVQTAFSSDKQLAIGLSTDDDFVGSDVADELWGLEGNDSITAGAGADILVGGGGDDVLNGGTNDDTACYFGNRLNYIVAQSDDGSVVITDKRQNGDGQDTVVGVENFRFADVTLNLADLLTTNNHAPTGITVSGGEVLENADIGAEIATLQGQDQDAGDTLTYSFVTDETGVTAATHSFFKIDGDKILLKAGLDDPQVGTHDLWVKVTDLGGLSAVRKVTLTVKNVNEAPTDIALNGASVLENATAGTQIGVLSASDPDAGETFSYQLVNDAEGRFAIHNGRLIVKDGARLDHEKAAAHQIKVKVTDQGGAGLSFEKTFTINVDDVSENLVIIGDKGKNVLSGGSSNDRLSGGYGNDVLSGGLVKTYSSSTRGSAHQPRIER